MSGPSAITIPVSAGELIDRITILEIKAGRFRDPSQAARREKSSTRCWPFARERSEVRRNWPS